jgi:hypothetical protein
MGKCTQIKKADAAALKVPPLRVLPILVSAGVAASLTSIIFTASSRNNETRILSEPPAARKTPPAAETIKALLDKPQVPTDADIALLNLMATPGLPADNNASSAKSVG